MSSQADVIWKDVWLGFGIALAGTVVVGAVLTLAAGPHMWWLVVANAAGLLAAGYLLSKRAAQFMGIAVALVTLFCYGLGALVLILGLMFEFLPDPLPGLPRGDSTFFFVWPVVALLGTLIGAAFGGQALTFSLESFRSSSLREQLRAEFAELVRGGKKVSTSTSGTGEPTPRSSWILPLTSFILAVIGVTWALWPSAPVGSATRSVVAEFVPGTKRLPGFIGASPVTVTSQPEALGTPDVTIDIEAQRAEFLPATIEVKKGQVVLLRITGLDNGIADLPETEGKLGFGDFSGHGYHITGPYDVYITGIRKGVTKEAIFKATHAGEFEINCVVFCSPDHYLMRGQLIVTE